MFIIKKAPISSGVGIVDVEVGMTNQTSCFLRNIVVFYLYFFDLNKII